MYPTGSCEARVMFQRLHHRTARLERAQVHTWRVRERNLDVHRARYGSAPRLGSDGLIGSVLDLPSFEPTARRDQEREHGLRLLRRPHRRQKRRLHRVSTG
jgi:hypothetical protein